MLVVLPDPDGRSSGTAVVLGLRPVERLAVAALEQGFEHVFMAPGTAAVPAGASEIATGEPVGRPALVVFEESFIHPDLLHLMVEHPLEDDERFSISDHLGRPVAWFTGRLAVVPAVMPVSEELELPESLSARDVGRVVDAEDIPIVEELVLRAAGITQSGARWWFQWVQRPTLRWLTRAGRPMAQLELIAVLVAVASGLLILLGGNWGLILAGFAMLAGVHMSRELRWVRSLRATTSAPTHDLDEQSLARATAPLAHAAATAALTYLLVAETQRSSLAGLVLLAAGGAAVLLSLGQARRLVRGQPREAFSLPDLTEIAGRLAMPVPSVLMGVPWLEIAFLVATVSGRPELPWSVLAAAGFARLWRWFAAKDLPRRESPQTLR